MPPTVETVWIVQHDDSPHNTVLGVFATQEEALEFAESVTEYPGAVLCSSFPVGYRYNAER